MHIVGTSLNPLPDETPPPESLSSGGASFEHSNQPPIDQFVTDESCGPDLAQYSFSSPSFKDASENEISDRELFIRRASSDRSPEAILGDALETIERLGILRDLGRHDRVPIQKVHGTWVVDHSDPGSQPAIGCGPIDSTEYPWLVIPIGRETREGASLTLKAAAHRSLQSALADACTRCIDTDRLSVHRWHGEPVTIIQARNNAYIVLPFDDYYVSLIAGEFHLGEG